MMFGRRRKQTGPAAEPADDALESDEAAGGEHAAQDAAAGPYDSAETGDEAESDGRLDLGSVRLPLVEGAQLQVEMSESGEPQAVHLLTEAGRITVAAFAAPRSAEMWSDVLDELAEALRNDGAAVRFEDGPWGQEVVGAGEAATLRFIGVDGPRWLVRAVAAGPEEAQAALAELTRELLANTVVVRGTEPLPVRTPLPVTLPPVLADQLEQARQQAAAQQAGEQPG